MSTYLLQKQPIIYLEETIYSDYVEGDFSSFKHTFLIRNPKSVGLSMQKIRRTYEERADGNFHFLNTLGFEELFRVYRCVKDNSANPIVVAAEHLQTNPR